MIYHDKPVFYCPVCPTPFINLILCYLIWTEKNYTVCPQCPQCPYFTGFGQTSYDLDTVGQTIFNCVSKLSTWLSLF